MGTKGEHYILEEAKEFTKTQLQRSLPLLPPQLHGQVAQALELPRHFRMARLEARRYIGQYAAQSDHEKDLLELALVDYNEIQTQHQMELAEVTRWSIHIYIYTSDFFLYVLTFLV